MRNQQEEQTEDKIQKAHEETEYDSQNEKVHQDEAHEVQSKEQINIYIVNVANVCYNSHGEQ